MSAEKARSASEWYFVHALAAVAFATLVALFSLALYLRVASLNAVNAPGFVRVFLGVGVLAVLWLWVRMLVDFFRERPARNPVLWGWILLLGNSIGGLLYFWVVWRPRSRPG